MKTITFTVNHEILGKPRPRFSNGHVYTPAKFLNYEKLIANSYRLVSSHKATKPVSVEIDIYDALPKSRPKKIQSEENTFKPDIDNVAKIVLDALNDVAYIDDAQVISLKVTKHQRERNITSHIKVKIQEQ